MEAVWVQNLFDIVWALDSLRNARLHPLGDVMIFENGFCCLFHFYILHSLTCIVARTDGNGFKTSTMRLGADAIVFTCTKDNRYFLHFYIDFVASARNRIRIFCNNPPLNYPKTNCTSFSSTLHKLHYETIFAKPYFKTAPFRRWHAKTLHEYAVSLGC